MHLFDSTSISKTRRRFVDSFFGWGQEGKNELSVRRPLRFLILVDREGERDRRCRHGRRRCCRRPPGLLLRDVLAHRVLVQPKAPPTVQVPACNKSPPELGCAPPMAKPYDGMLGAPSIVRVSSAAIYTSLLPPDSTWLPVIGCLPVHPEPLARMCSAGTPSFTNSAFTTSALCCESLCSWSSLTEGRCPLSACPSTNTKTFGHL